MLKFIFDNDTWQEIFEGIRKNKLRTAITIFGVTWGVFLLVTLLGFARGIENGFNKQIGGFATNSVFIWTQATGKAFKGYQKGRTFSLKMSDVKDLEERVSGVEFVVPRSLTNSSVKYGLKSLNEGVFGDYPRLDLVQKLHLITGRFINQNDIAQRKKICVIKETIYKQLFDTGEDPIGKYLIINDINYYIVGMYKEDNKGGGPSGGIHIPFTTFQQVYNRGDNIGWVMITGTPETNTSQLESDAKLLLKTIHKVHPEDERAFGSANVGQFFEKIMGFLKGIGFLTWFVGIATLIAGVFAIGNILLITVKERTQEIGIRRALGATPREIKQQIVLESVFLTAIAGALGIIFGGGILYVLDSLILSGKVEFLSNPTVDIPIILIAVLILIVLGTLIGLIPAHIATSIKPIDALRDE